MSATLFPSVSDAWQMICPGCRRDDNIRIFATVEVVLNPEGTTEAEDGTTAWDNHNSSYCNGCGYTGILQDFRDAYESLQRKKP